MYVLYILQVKSLIAINRSTFGIVPFIAWLFGDNFLFSEGCVKAWCLVRVYL